MLMQGITYNTTMALVVGTIMLLAVFYSRTVTVSGDRNTGGWGWAFIATGLFLGISGVHMMLTWPLDQIEGAFCCSVDNITFGEPAALYGVLTFVAGLVIILNQKRSKTGSQDEISNELPGAPSIYSTLRPLLIVGAIGGFGLILFGIAGMHFGQWRPPEIEPIARLMAGSLIEPLLVMALYLGTGISAIVSPFIDQNKVVRQIWMIGTLVVALVWIMLSFTIFYSHVGFFPQPDGSYK